MCARRVTSADDGHGAARRGASRRTTGVGPSLSFGANVRAAESVTRKPNALRLSRPDKIFGRHCTALQCAPWSNVTDGATTIALYLFSTSFTPLPPITRYPLPDAVSHNKSEDRISTGGREDLPSYHKSKRFYYTPVTVSHFDNSNIKKKKKNTCGIYSNRPPHHHHR